MGHSAVPRSQDTQNRRHHGLLLLAVTLVLACVLLAPANGSAAGDLDAEEQQFIQLLNAYRKEAGAAPLTQEGHLTEAASWMAADMGANNYFSHTDSLGRDMVTRLAAFGYGYNTYRGEILAAAAPTAQIALDAFKGSPPHDALMKSQVYVVVGVGRFYAPGSAYGWYWAVEFGGYAPPAPPAPPAPVPTETASPSPSPAAQATAAATPAAETPFVSPSPAPAPADSATPSPPPPSDRDGDGVPDDRDNCPDHPNPDQVLPPWRLGVGDPDCDGVPTELEEHVGTQPDLACAVNVVPDEPSTAWPPDMNDDGTVDLSDVLRYNEGFWAAAGNPDYNQRKDLNGDAQIELGDVLYLAFFFNKSCAW